MSGPLLSPKPPAPHIIGAVYNASSPAPADGQGCALQTDSSGNLLVNVVTGGGGGANASVGLTGATAPTSATEIGVIDNGGNLQGASSAHPVRVDPTGTTVQPVSGTVSVSNFPATQPVSGTVTVGNASLAVTGTFFQATQPVSGSVTVSGTVAFSNTTIAVTNAGTFAVQATLAAETTKVIGTVRNLGNAGAIFDAATAASVPANAVYKGVRGTTAFPTAVTDGQMVGAMADKAGRQVVVPNAVRDLVGTQQLNSSSSSLVSFIAAGATGVFNDIITFVATNESSTATIVSLSDGTLTYKFALAANGGIVINYNTPIPAASSATAWQVLNSAAVAVDFHAVYAKNK